jgi:tetratricopeptide (TPR) repeat protein
MNCESFAEYIYEYLTNSENMEYDLRSKFEEHLISCNNCWNVLESQKLMFGVLEEESDQLFVEVEIEELIDKANALKEKRKYTEALKCLREALELMPENKEAKKQLNEIRKIRIKNLAYDLIKKFYPAELDLFDMAWRVYNDISPKDFKEQAVSGSLGLVGHERSDLKTPQIIILLNEIGSHELEQPSDEELKDLTLKAGQATDCPQQLIDQLIDFLIKR